ncbi:hypothetical protein [Amycolatopsis sp. CA-230715]|uniref:hypothetical protein n=1 Tax=Amycolatopsis sp. CA-230715 TaxID=2745196 RepID=UPI001C02B3D6|nr:hypothetical protein [Amycolatopsis sp. CA-230715]QWF85778.1 hypothetical protein HUW46_09258 [Amycolatopsis sp. CA-230715]
MTITDHPHSYEASATPTVVRTAVASDLPDHEAAIDLAEQDWCEMCSRDEDDDPGMPRAIVSHSPGVALLECGHTVSRVA